MSDLMDAYKKYIGNESLMPDIEVPNIETSVYSALRDSIAQKFEPPEYEDTFLKDQAEDIVSQLSQGIMPQIEALEKISDSTKEIANSAAAQAETAERTAKAAQDNAEANKKAAEAAESHAKTAKEQAEASAEAAKRSEIEAKRAWIIAVISAIISLLSLAASIVFGILGLRAG